MENGREGTAFMKEQIRAHSPLCRVRTGYAILLWRAGYIKR